jgi:hypothetical protein
MERIMTIKTLSAIALVSAALCGPVFAQDPGAEGMGYQKPAHAHKHLRAAYNQAPLYANPRQSEGMLLDTYGWDRSRVGDEDPDLRPAAN